jgi:predicted ATP-dependent endonuclease of OLD family
MRITKINISNFRSFDEEGVEINLPEIDKPFSIVGHNNSGKSNLLNAILLGLNNKSTNYGSFDQNDFYNHQLDKEIEINIEISPPIKNPNIFNKFNDIEAFNLKVKKDEGVIETSHYCLDGEGKTIFNPASLKRGKTAKFSPEEKEVLNKKLKQGAQTAYKWKDQVPLYFIDPTTIHNQLRANRGTLLGKVLLDIRKEFESNETVIADKKGVFAHHVGQPNLDVFNKMLKYIEKQVIPTPKLEKLTDQIKQTIKEELEIENDDFDLEFGFPSVETFYKNLEFYVKEHENKPRLPISRFGNGFIFLFVISLFKSIIESENGGNIFVIEEPETFLHEHYQEYFYKILEKLSANNQVIYTTHSKKFVNLFHPQSIIKLKTPEFSKSQVIHHPETGLDVPEKIEDYTIKSIDDFAVYMKTLEPNLGNIIFAKKVIIVEGPHDVLGYRTVLATKYNLEYNNVSIVAAWGKDTLKSIIQLCKLFEIEFFVIHDFDIQTDCDITIPSTEPGSVYSGLGSNEKAQYTKNFNIFMEAGIENIHHNKPNLEGVLGITDKGTVSVYQNLSGKTVEEVFVEFPNFLPKELIAFIEKK